MSSLTKILNTPSKQNRKKRAKDRQRMLELKSKAAQYSWETNVERTLGYPPTEKEREIFNVFKRQTINHYR